LACLIQFADLWPHMNVVLRTPVEAVHSCNNEYTLSTPSVLNKGRECTKTRFCHGTEKFQASLAAATEKHLHPVFNAGGVDGLYSPFALERPR
jgi:hypothetical protein